MVHCNVRSKDGWLTEIIVVLSPLTAAWQSNITIHFLEMFLLLVYLIFIKNIRLQLWQCIYASSGWLSNAVCHYWVICC